MISFETRTFDVLPSKFHIYSLFDKLNSRNGTYASLALICVVARLLSPNTRKVITDLSSGGQKSFLAPAYAVVLGRSLKMPLDVQIRSVGAENDQHAEMINLVGKPVS